MKYLYHRLNCTRPGRLSLAVLALSAVILFQGLMPTCTQAGTQMSKGQTIYVPAYSHIYIGHKASPYMLCVTLSIRNIDPRASLNLTVVDYYDTQGRLIKHHLDAPITLAPMASTRYVVPAPDKTGGSGANFIVQWKSMDEINPPIIETIMIGTQSQQGISFTSRGEIIQE